jgi:hypothetical protein
MSVPIKIFLLCPIPESQKPINEYINLKDATFLFTTKNYKKQFFFPATLLFLLCFLLLGSFDSFFMPLLLSNIFLFFFYFLIYIQWKEMKNRFLEARIFYEEGSWYDGQIWEKPFLLIKNDRLLVSQKIDPIIQRVSRTILVVFYFTLFLLLIENIIKL